MKRFSMWLMIFSGLVGCAGGAPAVAPADPPAALVSPSPQSPAPPAQPGTPTSPEHDQTLKRLLSQKDVFAFIDVHSSLLLGDSSSSSAPIWDESYVDSFAWSPDGLQIAFIANRSVYRWSAETNVVDLVDRDGVFSGPPSWTPDSTAFAVTADAGESYIKFYDLTTPQKTLRNLAGLNIQPLLAPRGTAVIAAREHIASRDSPVTVGDYEGVWAVPLIWPSTAPTTEPVILEAAINVMSWKRVAWSADGELVAVSNVLVDRQGAIVEQLGPPALGLTGNLTSETIANGMAPDGNHIAVASLVAPNPDAPQQKHIELEIFARPGGKRTTIWQSTPREETGFFWRVSRVNWSPDGQQLAFAGAGSTPDGQHQGAGVWVGAADGSNLQFVPGSEDAEMSLSPFPEAPQWSGDSKQLLFITRQGATPLTINIWSLGNSPPHQLTDGSQPAWRP